MGPIDAVTLSGSGRGLVVLGIMLGLLVLNFFAVTKIVTKAGYSYGGSTCPSRRWSCGAPASSSWPST